MFSVSRRRLVGLLGASLIPVALGTIALPAHALSPEDPVATSTCTNVPGNLVVNCGFESPQTPNGAVPGWTHLVSNASTVLNETVAAHAGGNGLAFFSRHGADVWTQTISVQPNTQYLVGAYVRSTDNSSTPADSIDFTATNVGADSDGTTIFSSSNALIADWAEVGRLVATGTGHTMTITLSGFNAPGDNYVDDVFVAPQLAGCAAIANNLVSNCGFEASASAPTSWTADTAIQKSGVTTGASEGGTQSLYFGPAVETTPGSKTSRYDLTPRTP